MNRSLWLLLANDLAIAFKNKTVYLMLFIPLFVFLSLAAVDRQGAEAASLKLAVLRAANYPRGLVASLEAAPESFHLTWLASPEQARLSVEAKAVDGALLAKELQGALSTELVVVDPASLKTMAIITGLTQLQHAADGKNGGAWVGELSALNEGRSLEGETLPIWVLMMILLVGFLVVPPQVAEDKEKKWLLGLLQTPVRESQWLLAKVAAGMVLAVLPILLLHALSRSGFGYAPAYLALIMAGAFCFSSVGLLLGCLCRTQASARALGVVLYLPHLLPSALGEVSVKLRLIAKFIPSYHLFTPLRRVLLGGGHWEGCAWSLAYLIAAGCVCCVIAHILIKKRWQI